MFSLSAQSGSKIHAATTEKSPLSSARGTADADDDEQSSSPEFGNFAELGFNQR
jgi:hypothetical protein